VWNPPGSGDRGGRFARAGGVRAFFSSSTRFQLADTPPLRISDVTHRATSTWVYVGAEINNQLIYCWLLRSWNTPVKNGDGSNF
jgi:hypothetical protein